MKNTSGGLSRVKIWSIIVAIGVIVGIISSCITIYEFPGFIRSMVSSGSTPTSGISQQGTGVAGVKQTPTQSLPTSTPTPPPINTVLYQANQSWSGWNGSGGWKVSGGLLLNDGTYADSHTMPTITAPYQPGADYAVEIKMQVVSAMTTGILRLMVPDLFVVRFTW